MEISFKEDQITVYGDEIIFLFKLYSERDNSKSIVKDLSEVFEGIFSRKELEDIYNRTTFIDLILSYPLSLYIHDFFYNYFISEGCTSFVDLEGKEVKKYNNVYGGRLGNIRGAFNIDEEYTRRYIREFKDNVSEEDTLIKEEFLRAYLLCKVSEKVFSGFYKERLERVREENRIPYIEDVIESHLEELDEMMSSFLLCMCNLSKRHYYISNEFYLKREYVIPDSIRDYISMTTPENSHKFLH